jgi:hypothetical protein
MELKLALTRFAEGATGTENPGAMQAIASEIAHAQPARRRGATASASYPPAGANAAFASPSVATAPLGESTAVAQIVAAMQALAHESPSVFQEISLGLASSFRGVASSTSGPGSDAMATLASQLQQAAMLGSTLVDPRETPEAEPTLGPVVSVRRANEVFGEASRAREG